MSRLKPLDGSYEKLWVPKRSIYWRNNERQRKKRGEALTLIRQPLFNGYLFADAVDFVPLYDALVYVRLDSTFSLMGRQDGQRRIVTEEELDWIFKLSAEEPSRVFKVGDKVVFTDDSPLSGFDGYITKMDWKKHRVCVSIPFFDEGEKSIWIAADSVDPAADW